MRAIRTVMLVVGIVGLAACGGGSDDSGAADAKNDAAVPADVEVLLPPDVTGDGSLLDRSALETHGLDVVSPPNALMPPPLVLEKFTVNLVASTTLCTVGQPVTLDALPARGEAAGDLAAVWDLGGADPGAENPADGHHQVVTFSKPGLFLVSVTMTDANGDASEAGAVVNVLAAADGFTVGDVDGDGSVTADDVEAVRAHIEDGKLLALDQFRRAEVDLDGRLRAEDMDLIQSAVDAGEPAPTRLWPTSGALGRKVRLIHPALLDVSREARVVFEGAEPLVPVRGLPGYATFVVPPEMGTPGTVSLTLEMGGETADVFDFDVLALPAASPEPGARVLEALALLEEVLTEFPKTLDLYFQTMGANEQQLAVIQGLAFVARDTVITHRAAFVDAFSMMEPDGRAAFEQLALANGLDEVISQLQEARARINASLPAGGLPTIDAGTAANLLSILCAAYDITDLASQVADINSEVASYLGWFDWWPMNKIPIVGQVINFLSAVSNAISAMTDIVDMISQFLPEIGPMKVEASPKSLDVSQSAEVKAAVKILLGSKLCSAALGSLIGSLMDQIKETLTNKLGASIPLANDAFKAYDFDREKMDVVTGLVYDCIGGIVGAVMDALGLQDALTGLANAICDALGGDPWLPLPPDIIKASCGGVAGGSWTCVEKCIGGVAFKAKTQICGKEREAEAAIECKGCTPDNCPGCCDGKSKCVLFPNQSDAKCGKGGAQCAPCQSPDKCEQGTCTCPSNCQTAGALTCQGNDVYVCTEIKPGCLQTQFHEACINGAKCVAGKCEGGCTAANCPGCCMGDGTCVNPPTNDHCGAAGSTCGYCAYPDQCVGGTCTCVPDCLNKQCGDDACGGSCGVCDPGFDCKAYQCECIPDCFLNDCGDDGCGGSCGDCTPPDECDGGVCNCIPDCFLWDCGDDGCGGSCGTCPTPQTCVGGWCDLGKDCLDAADCNDGDVCTEDTCSDGGTCANTPATGAPCNDGDLCTAWDMCVGGICTGAPKTCSDSNTCTDDYCIEGDCIHEPLSGIPCDDGMACTIDDTCQSGKCIGTPKETPAP